MAKIFYKEGSSWKELIALAYPVGAIYLTTNDTSPAELFGGSWSELKGRYYLRGYTTDSNGFANAGETGGSNYIYTRHLPSHSHPQNQYTFLSRASAEKKFQNVNQGYYIGTVIETGEALTQPTGDGELYLPAYYVVHIYRRTA